MRPVLSLLLLATALASPGRAGEREAVLAQAAAAEHSLDLGKALQCYLAADRLQPNDPVVLQKIARQYSNLSDGIASPEERRRMVETALGYAERSVALQPKSAVNVLSLAICHGKLAAVSAVRQKIALSRLVRDEALRALDLDPSYGWADYVLGCWNLGVASLNGAERLVTRVFYGGLPPASVDNAIHLLQRAVELDPDEPTHVIELGFAYRAAGRETAARAAFQRGLAMQSREAFDLEAQGRARLALSDPDAK